MSDEKQKRALQVGVLTAVGRGAIATIAVRGDLAEQAVSKHFRPAGGKFSIEVDRIRFGTWLRSDRDQHGESIVVCATNKTAIEIHCHGGRAAVEAIVGDLEAAGATRVSSDAWLVEQNLLQRECQQILAQTRTTRSAAIVLDQCRGALEREAVKVVEHLRKRENDRAREILESLISRYRLGRHLVDPFRVVIAGPPNVGKSSLINVLLGFERAITFDQPGTTRDVLSSTTAFDGWLVTLSDTAGIRETSEDIEQQGVWRAEKEIESADLVLLVGDATEGWTDQHEKIAASSEHSIRVLNKLDLANPKPVLENGVIGTSTVTREGIEVLIEAIASSLVPLKVEPGDAVPLNARQLQWCEDVFASSDTHELVVSLESLILGH